MVYYYSLSLTWLAEWCSMLALINVVHQHWAQLLHGRATVCGHVNRLGM